MPEYNTIIVTHQCFFQRFGKARIFSEINLPESWFSLFSLSARRRRRQTRFSVQNKFLYVWEPIILNWFVSPFWKSPDFLFTTKDLIKQKFAVTHTPPKAGKFWGFRGIFWRFSVGFCVNIKFSWISSCISLFYFGGDSLRQNEISTTCALTKHTGNKLKKRVAACTVLESNNVFLQIT